MVQLLHHLRNKKLVVAQRAFLLVARTLLVTKGIATRNKCLTSSNKKLLETRAIILGAKDATSNKGHRY